MGTKFLVVKFLLVVVSILVTGSFRVPLDMYCKYVCRVQYSRVQYSRLRARQHPIDAAVKIFFFFF